MNEHNKPEIENYRYISIANVTAYKVDIKSCFMCGYVSV